MASLYADHAREVLGLPEGWQLAAWRVMDWRTKGFGHLEGRIRVTMRKAPLKADGQVDWDAAPKVRSKQATFTNAEHAQFCAAWEARTGRCHVCSERYPGLEWVGWNRDTGDSYRSCPRCKGTGKAPGVTRA